MGKQLVGGELTVKANRELPARARRKRKAEEGVYLGARTS